MIETSRCPPPLQKITTPISWTLSLARESSSTKALPILAMPSKPSPSRGCSEVYAPACEDSHYIRVCDCREQPRTSGGVPHREPCIAHGTGRIRGWPASGVGLSEFAAHKIRKGRIVVAKRKHSTRINRPPSFNLHHRDRLTYLEPAVPMGNR